MNSAMTCPLLILLVTLGTGRAAGALHAGQPVPSPSPPYVRLTEWARANHLEIQTAQAIVEGLLAYKKATEQAT